MHWAQALVFCGCLMGASIYDVRHRLVDDRVCVALVLAGLITISPASFLGALAGGLPFYLGGGLWEKRGRGYGACGVSGVCAGPFRTLAGLTLFAFCYALFVLGKSLVLKLLPPPHPVHLPTGPVHCRRIHSPHISYKEAYMKIFRNRTVIGVLCILLALVICFGVTPLFSRSASEKAEIVRVTADIKEGDEITAEMVQTVEVGAYNLPSGIMTEKDEVVGKYATADLKVGDYILASKLSNEPAAENAYLYNLDGTKQAISVTIKSFATGLSGKLESGDIVSVLVADYQGMGETVIPPELQYVEVISVTASSGYDANTGEAVEDEKELPSTVTLLVTTEQAKVLAGLEQESELHLALVYRGTPENAIRIH